MTPLKPWGGPFFEVGVFAILLAICASVYHGILSAPFIFDDWASIVENESIRQLIPPTWFGHQPRPVANLTFALNYAFGRLDVAGYHIVNVILHAACAQLGFLVSRRILKRADLALIATVLWTVHPLHTSVVTYTVHRYELCVALFMLGALYFFQKGLRTPAASGRFNTLSIACAVLACASKEVSIALPFLLLAYDRCFEAGGLWKALQLRPKYHLAAFATLGVLLVLQLSSPRNTSQGFGLGGLTSFDYARTELRVIPYYFRLAVWPDTLSFDYYDWPIAQTWGEVVLPAIFVFGLVALGILSWVRFPRVGFAAAVWIFILAPTSTFLPLKGELVAERRVYLPLFALSVLVVKGASCLATSLGKRRVMVAISVAVSLAFGARTIKRNRDFLTEEAAYRSVLDVRPMNVRARYHLANALHAQGKVDEALNEYLRAAAQEPNFVKCRSNAGVLLAVKGRLPEAEDQFLAAVRLEPANVEFRLNLVESRVLQGKWSAALKTLHRGLERNPANAALRERLVRVEQQVGQHCSTGEPRPSNCP